MACLYSAFTYYTGFKVNSGEYKVMGLAPYGEPRFKDKILEHLIDVKPDGSFRLDMSYFNYCTGLTMTNGRFNELFGAPPRKPDELLTDFHMDLAASIQAVTDEIVLRLTRSLREETGIRNLCLAGGVALNCVANGKVLREGVLRPASISSPPPATRAARWAPRSSAITCSADGSARRTATPCAAPTSGRSTRRPTSRRACARPARASRCWMMPASSRRSAEDLSQGKAMGWFQGRMEFGPRALGNRSILGDPRSPTMQKTLNLKVKYRESFRPFAPSVLRERVSDWFEMDSDSPYMLLVADVVEAPAARDDGGGEAVVRHRQAQRAALRYSRGHARRLLGAHPDRASGHQSRATTRCCRSSSAGPAARSS